MRAKTTLLLPLLPLVFSAAGSSQEPVAESKVQQNDFVPTATIREIVQSMVVPQSTALFAATSVTTNERGATQNLPKTDEEWAALRRQVITLAEASNLLVMTGRRIAKPGETAQDPTGYLQPDRIAELIEGSRADWIKMSQDMHGAAMDAVKAIDARDARDLSRATDRITETCEVCHRKFWHVPRSNRRGGVDTPRGGRR